MEFKRHPTDEEQMLATLAAVPDPSTPVEVIADVLGKVEAYYARAKELRDNLKAAMVEHIEATGRDITIGATRYYAGHEKTTTCVNVRDAAEALLKKLEGDFGALTEYLVAQPFKPGACGKLLDAEAFAACFRTEVKRRLKEGEPRKVLMQTWEPVK